MERGMGLLALLNAAREVLAALDLPEAAGFLADWPLLDDEPATPPPRSLPVLRWIGDTPRGSVPGTAALTALVAAAADRLVWRRSYSAQDIGQAFLDRYGWTELVGRRGPIASDRLACGLLLLGPDIEYPRHSHEAAEIYVPLSGSAWWWRADDRWASRSPGEPVFHPPWMAHAMRTTSRPLLALYVWHGGDLRQKSRFTP